MRRSTSIFCALALAACGEDNVQMDPPDGGMVSVGMDVVLNPADLGVQADGGGDEGDATVDEDGGAGDLGVADGGMTSNPTMSAGCGLAHAGGETMEMMDVDGEMREYLLTVPSNYDPNTPLPLVFGWHGSGGSGPTLRGMGLPDVARNLIIAVHPNGTRVGGNTGWVLDPIGKDAAFFDALMTQISDTLCVDLTRVFSYGFSFGGYMSNMLGCVRGETLAGIAPFHGGGPSSSWTCEGSVSAMISNAEMDQTVLIGEGIASRDHWLMENGCDPTMSMPVEPEPCVEYLGCQGGERVLWCHELTGGHAPPSDLPQRTWAFFSTF